MDEPNAAAGTGDDAPWGLTLPDLAVRIFTPPAGELTMEAHGDHVITIHIGAPARVTCRYAGRTHQRLEAHGDIDVVPAGVAGAWEDETPVTALVVRLSPGLVGTAAEALGWPAARAVIAPQYQLRDPQIEHIGWALKAGVEADAPGGRLCAESLGLALAARLLQLGGAPPAPRRRPRDTLSERQQRRVVDYIEAHLDRDLSLARLAGLAGVSRSHFKALFRHSLGLPVHQYVVRRRVERARALLLEGRLPLCQVALETGFAHQSHLARWMRRLHGVTPTDVTRSRR